MTHYSVNKYFGHFWQCWDVYAENEIDAWNDAERIGRLQYQNIYGEPFDIHNKGYVKDMDATEKEHPPIDTETYNKWMREAEKMGMVIRPEEYEKIYGLPFKNVW